MGGWGRGLASKPVRTWRQGLDRSREMAAAAESVSAAGAWLVRVPPSPSRTELPGWERGRPPVLVVQIETDVEKGPGRPG